GPGGEPCVLREVFGRGSCKGQGRSDQVSTTDWTAEFGAIRKASGRRGQYGQPSWRRVGVGGCGDGGIGAGEGGRNCDARTAQGELLLRQSDEVLGDRSGRRRV